MGKRQNKLTLKQNMQITELTIYKIYFQDLNITNTNEIKLWKQKQEHTYCTDEQPSYSNIPRVPQPIWAPARGPGPVGLFFLSISIL